MSHYCAADTRCAEYNRTTGQPAIIEAGVICPDCERVATRIAGRLLVDYRDLEEHLAPSASQRLDGMPGGSADPAIPIRTDIEALQRSIWWVTTAWAEILADRERLTGLSKRVRDGWAVQWAVGIIQPRVRLLAMVGPQELADYPITDEDEAIRHRSLSIVTITGVDGILDMIWLHRRAAAVLGLTKLIRQIPGRCAACARSEALRQEEGGETVWCDQCGASETRDQYEHRVNLLGVR